MLSISRTLSHRRRVAAYLQRHIRGTRPLRAQSGCGRSRDCYDDAKGTDLFGQRRSVQLGRVCTCATIGANLLIPRFLAPHFFPERETQFWARFMAFLCDRNQKKKEEKKKLGGLVLRIKSLNFTKMGMNLKESGVKNKGEALFFSLFFVCGGVRSARASFRLRCAACSPIPGGRRGDVP